MALAGKELGERQDAQLGDLLLDAGQAVGGRDKVAHDGEGDHDLEAALDEPAVAKDLDEELGGHHVAAGQQLGIGEDGEVGDVGEDVEHGGEADGREGGHLEDLGLVTARATHLRKHVVGVLPASVGPQDAEDGVRVFPHAHRLGSHGVVPVLEPVAGFAIVHALATTAGHGGEADHDDEGHQADLVECQQVVDRDTHLAGEDVEEADGCQQAERDELLQAVVGIDVAGLEGLQHQLGEGDGVAGKVGQQDEQPGDDDDGQVLWPGIAFFDLGRLARVAHGRGGGCVIHKQLQHRRRVE